MRHTAISTSPRRSASASLVKREWYGTPSCCFFRPPAQCKRGATIWAAGVKTVCGVMDGSRPGTSFRRRCPRSSGGTSSRSLSLSLVAWRTTVTSEWVRDHPILTRHTVVAMSPITPSHSQVGPHHALRARLHGGRDAVRGMGGACAARRARTTRRSRLARRDGGSRASERVKPPPEQASSS